MTEDEVNNLDDGLYVYHKDEKQGPYSNDEIMQRIEDGTFTPDILVWRNGMDERKPVFSVIHFPGIGRLLFFVLFISVNIIGFALLFVTTKEGDRSFMGVLMIVAVFAPVIYRLKNIGRNTTWSLLILVPIINLIVILPCLILPEGYDFTKKLDKASKIIVAAIFASAFIGILYSIIFLF